MTTAAAWVVALAAWLGAAVALPGTATAWSPATWGVPAGVGLAALGVAVAAGAAGWPDRHGAVDGAGRPARTVRLVLLALAAAMVTAGSAGARAAVAADGVLAELGAARAAATVRATAVTDVRGDGGGWQVVRVDAVDGRRVRERAWWWLEDAASAPTVGQRVRADVRVAALGAGGLDRHAARLHAVARLRPRAPPQVVADAGWLLRSSERVRARTAAANRRHLDDTRAGLLTALVTGDRRDEPAGLRDDFADAGLTHLVVVSGKHVAGVLAGVLAVAALARLAAAPRRVVALGALAWFVVLTRWQPSVLRAGAMAALVLAAGIGGRGSDARHALAAAVTVLLLVDPLLAGQLGFGLSVGATAGVLIVAPWVARRLPCPRALAVPLGVTIGAQLGATPLLLTLDGVGIGSLPANLVAVPAAGLAQAVGLVAALAAQVSVAVGGTVAAFAGPAVTTIVWAAETFATGPRLTAATLASPLPWLVAAAVVVAWRARRRVAWLPPPAAVGIAVVLVALAVLPGRGPDDVDRLTVTFFDVGQGLSVLVEAPDGQGTARMLYDAGRDDAALARLQDRGVEALDVLVLSHPHDDHSGGMPAVVRAMDVERLLVGPDASHEALARSVHESYATARAHGVDRVVVAEGQRFPLGDATVRVLAPPGDGGSGREPNDASVVLHVVHDDGRLLLAGDAEEPAQRRLLRRRRGRLPAAVVQVPHHGGDTNAEGFLAAVGAQVGVIGVGTANPFGHPSDAVLADLAAAGTEVYRTDLHGTVTVVLDGGRARVESPRRRRASGRRYRSRGSVDRGVRHHVASGLGRRAGRARRVRPGLARAGLVADPRGTRDPRAVAGRRRPPHRQHRRAGPARQTDHRPARRHRRS